MKRKLFTLLAIFTALNACPQGTVIFNNRIAGSLITHVYYGPGYTYRTGNGSNDTPSGTVDYAGAIPLSGSTWFAQLLAANGAGQPESILTPQGQTTTFRTGAAAGNLAGITATLANVPKDSLAATFELVAWDNSSGLYSTWSQASIAWMGGQTFAGRSAPFTVFAIGGDLNPAPILTGLQSFSFPVPEPSSFVLVGLGIAVTLLRLRKSKSSGS